MSENQSERIVAPIPGTMPRKTWLDRLGVGLAKSSKQFTEQVAAVLTKRKLDQDALDELEEMLIEADLGTAAAARVTEAFGRSRFGREVDENEIKEALADAIAAELRPHQARFEPLGGARPYVVLFVGVNGSGKTTTLGKIAADLTGKGPR
jgi:fused signal recognition particle receptor